MGRVPALAPAEARLGAATMLCLAILSLAVAGLVYSTGAIERSALFVVLAIIGLWQAAFYWRGH